MRLSTLMFMRARLLTVVATRADVVAKSATGFVSKHVLTISRLGRAYFMRSPTRSVDGGILSIRIRVLRPTSPSTRAPVVASASASKDGSVAHMTVVFVERDSVLRMIGGLGPLQAMAVNGSMTFTLAQTDNGATRLEYEYAVGGYSPEGLEGIAEPVDGVQLEQLRRLQRFVETGNPAAPTRP